jgi:HSP20 family molecular chaperone IbpA
MLNEFFYEWDDKVKPPVAASSIPGVSAPGGRTSCAGVRVQLALAGYKEEDIKVFFEKDVLYVTGDNTNRENVDPKFRSTFSNRFPVSKELNLLKATTTFEDGLLTISIPLCKEETPRTYLFGK